MPMVQTGQILDRESALSRVGGDVELLREIGALFLEECPTAMDELRQAVVARDANLIEHRAHSLKGSVATFGAGAAAAAALELERQGHNSDFHQVESSLQRFELSVAMLCSDLRALIAE